jgi:hypothetical protein
MISVREAQSFFGISASFSEHMGTIDFSGVWQFSTVFLFPIAQSMFAQ